MAILITGGLGYIGQHTVVELLNSGYDCIVVDNLSNSCIEVKERIKRVSNRDFKFYNVDVCDKKAFKKAFEENQIDSVIHFAGLKCISESIKIPLEYYHNNVVGSIVLLELMKEFEISNLVFSSSAVVYGNPYTTPVTEDFPTQVTNPYGRCKVIIENILHDLWRTNHNFQIAILRYFNPIGAHESGLLGEYHEGKPNNLVPYIAKVAVGEIEYLNITGSDFQTHDGTGVRDYIHVMDLAHGHILALNKLKKRPGLVTYNLGTGIGYSVLDVIKTYEVTNNKEVPYRFIDRRKGDVDACYADVSLAEKELGFKAKYTLEDMCRSSYEFQLKNPKGFKSEV